MNVLKKAQVRPPADIKSLRDNVTDIIDQVRQRGDQALISFNTRFDNNSNEALRVDRQAIEEAYSKVSPQLIEAMRIAANNIRHFAEKQKETIQPLPEVEVYPGVKLGHRVVPMDACACYVPGGNYPLFSTALMLVIPASVAGVKRITACSPAQKATGEVAPETLVALDIAGVHDIYRVGGAHAIAGFAYGTESLPKVDIIVGPGNQFVTEAKRQCYGEVGIDFVAGPSEVMVIADESADPQIIAADLLGQSEHDLLAKGILVTTSESLGKAVIEAVESQLKTLETAEIASQSWQTFGEVIVVDSLKEAVDMANQMAPEHLEIAISDPKAIQNDLHNYGSLFVGEYSAEVFGDYISGTNHTLPTLKAARYTGGVYVGTFLKTLTFQSLSEDAVKDLGPHASLMARSEGLMAHANAVEVRLKKLK